MAARYFSRVSTELLPHLHYGGRLPENLRLIREVREVAYGVVLVEFEDTDAPPHFEGCEVTFVVNREAGRRGPNEPMTPTRTWISDLTVTRSAEEVRADA